MAVMAPGFGPTIRAPRRIPAIEVGGGDGNGRKSASVTGAAEGDFRTLGLVAEHARNFTGILT